MLSAPCPFFPLTRTRTNFGPVCHVSLASSALPQHTWARTRGAGLNYVPVEITATFLKHDALPALSILRGLPACISPTHGFFILLHQCLNCSAKSRVIINQHTLLVSLHTPLRCAELRFVYHAAFVYGTLDTPV